MSHFIWFTYIPHNFDFLRTGNYSRGQSCLQDWRWTNQGQFKLPRASCARGPQPIRGEYFMSAHLKFEAHFVARVFASFVFGYYFLPPSPGPRTPAIFRSRPSFFSETLMARQLLRLWILKFCFVPQPGLANCEF